MTRNAPNDALASAANHGWNLALHDVRTTGAALAAATEAFDERRGELARLLSRPPTEVMLTGCGSALSVASVVAPFMQAWAHVTTRAVPSSELLFNFDRVGPATSDPLLIAFSRTGRTTETVLAATSFATRFPGRVVVLTCASGEPLSGTAAVPIEAPDARDAALPQTRSYAAMLLLGLKAAASIARAETEAAALDEAAHVVAASLETNGAGSLACGAETPASSLVFLGSGPLAGLAREGAIKTIEMSLTPAESLPFLEVRHGPNAIVGRAVHVVGLVSPRPAAAELLVLRDLALQGAEITTVAPGDVDGAYRSRSRFLASPSLPEQLLPFAYLPVIQMIALGRAKAVGANPNEPPHLHHYVEVEDLEAFVARV